MSKFKKIILCLCVICGSAFAETLNIDWTNGDGTIYASTTCETGDDLILPPTPTKTGYTFVGWALYTPIEYLESTGTQYIDTGYKLNSSHVKMHVKFKKKTNDSGSVIGASNTISDSNWYTLFCSYTWGCYWAIGDSSNKAQYSYSLNTIYDIEFETFSDGNFVCQNNSNNSIGTWGGNFIGNLMGNVYLYTMSYRPSEQTWISSDLVIYFAKINEDGVIVRDFIPVLDSSGTPCLYDKITNQFFYNAGSGDFIAGPVVSE